ncbi:hypothetical protein SPHINGOAX6_70600 [Sphingomonas sp. AX6]|nr:hypothetical protein SPHINGOAX6_70600 [Sphingomonas sp. AX6]
MKPRAKVVLTLAATDGAQRLSGAEFVHHYAMQSAAVRNFTTIDYALVSASHF